jgi:hypothetical protein
MANLRIKIKGTPRIAEIDAAAVEDDKQNSELRATDAQAKVIARFDLKKVVGWWIEPPTNEQLNNLDLAERIKQGRARVARLEK